MDLLGIIFSPVVLPRGPQEAPKRPRRPPQSSSNLRDEALQPLESHGNNTTVPLCQVFCDLPRWQIAEHLPRAPPQSSYNTAFRNFRYLNMQNSKFENWPWFRLLFLRDCSGTRLSVYRTLFHTKNTYEKPRAMCPGRGPGFVLRCL